MLQHGGVEARWWLPGVVVAAGTTVVGWAVTTGWYAFADAGCGSPGAKFACLVESLVAVAVAVVVGPVLLWLAYRAAGARRPVLSTLLAGAVAFVLQAAPVLVGAVADLVGVPGGWGTSGRYPPLLVAVLLGLAALAGGFALQGPRRRWRAAVAGAALALLCVAAVSLQGPAERARTDARLAEATVPLLLPSAQWQPYGPYVGADGSLTYDAVPVGWPGYGFEGVRVSISGRTADLGDTCGFRSCADSGGVRYETADAGSGTKAWRLVDGHLVTVQSYGDDGPLLDPVEFLGGIAPVDRETFLDRRFTDR